MKKVSKNLKAWFLVHFGVDMLIGIPLLMAPVELVNAFGLQMTDTYMARIVGAALIAIGMTSAIVQDEGEEVFMVMLKLKMLWSGFAIVGMLFALAAGESQVLWIFIGIFAFFFHLWYEFHNTYAQKRERVLIKEKLSKNK